MDDCQTKCIGRFLYGVENLGWTPINIFCDRETLKKLMQKIDIRLAKYCYFCGKCLLCKLKEVRLAELKKMGFWSYNNKH